MNIGGNLLIVTLLLLAVTAFAKDIGTVGKTYPVVERDALTEIEEHARGIDWKKMYAQERPEKYRPENLRNLPRASRTRSYQVDLTYTLDADIPDGKGGILFPKGYSFNPLDYVPFNKVLVLIDGDDHEQVEWFVGSHFRADPKVMLLLTGGSSAHLQKSLKRPVFYATGPVVSRFRISAVPSVIQAKGRVMEVNEIPVQRKKIGNSRLTGEGKWSAS